MESLESTPALESSLEQQSKWRFSLYNRLLADYCARIGDVEAARRIVSVYALDGMVDIELHAEASRVREALEQAKDCRPALQWVTEHRAAIRKAIETQAMAGGLPGEACASSIASLEFCLRRQEFIQLMQAGRDDDAYLYARKHLRCAEGGNPGPPAPGSFSVTQVKNTLMALLLPPARRSAPTGTHSSMTRSTTAPWGSSFTTPFAPSTASARTPR